MCFGTSKVTQEVGHTEELQDPVSLASQMPTTACKEDSNCVAGYRFSYSSAAISWSSRKHTYVETTSTDAELHALSEATKAALHLQAILEILSRLPSAKLMCDSQ